MTTALRLSLDDWILARRRLPYRSGTRVVVVLGDEQAGKSALIAGWSAVQRKGWAGSLQSADPRAHELSLKSPVGTVYVKEVDGRKSVEALEYSMSAAVCCVLCVSLADRLSSQSAKEKWASAVRHCCTADTPIVLVGTKIDVRSALEQQRKQLRMCERDIALQCKGLVPETLLEQVEKRQFTVEMLPEEVLQRIFSMLCIYDRCRAAEVCRMWSIVLKDGFLWQGIVRGSPVSSRELQALGKSISASAVVECTSAKSKTMIKAMAATVKAIKR